MQHAPELADMSHVSPDALLQLLGGGMAATTVLAPGTLMATLSLHGSEQFSFWHFIELSLYIGWLE
jgi:hypothetical protein